VAVKLCCDGGPWEPVAECTAVKKRVVTLPIVPRRCVFLRLRLEGQGDMVLYSVTRITETGTELPVKGG